MYPTLFHIGSIPVRSYGTMVIVGFLLALWRTMKVCERRMKTEPEGSPRRVPPENIFDLGLLCLLFGLLGARLLFVLLDWKAFVKNPLSLFQLWEGGLSLHGSLIGGILVLAVYSRRKRFSLAVLGDLAAPAFFLAYAFGRVGCFLNGCCYGAACSLPWAVQFPDENHPGQLTPPSHPIQLYATVISLLIFAFLVRWESRPYRDGELFWGGIGLYGIYRGAVEFLRVGATSTVLIPGTPLTETHLISLLMIGASAWGLARLRATPRPAAA
jgi:phosphatidylglycerol---prolipoprotein diacylglyceryl transferase